MNEPDEKRIKMRRAIISAVETLRQQGSVFDFEPTWENINKFPPEVVQKVKDIYRNGLSTYREEYQRLYDLYKLPHRSWEKIVAEQDPVGVRIREKLPILLTQITLFEYMCIQPEAALSDLMVADDSIQRSIEEIRKMGE